jgi:hypothetical protein
VGMSRKLRAQAISALATSVEERIDTLETRVLLLEMRRASVL